jgi:hypothetical protein
MARSCENQAATALKAPWPSALPEQAQAIAATLAAQNEPATPAQGAKLSTRTQD